MKRILAFILALFPAACEVDFAAAQNTFFAASPGQMIYRGATGWAPVTAPTSSGQFLISQGATAMPVWTFNLSALPSTAYTWPTIPTNRVMGNATGSNASFTAITVNQVLDMVGYDTLRPPGPSAMLYKDPTTGTWQALSAGPVGWVLVGGGTTAPPSWSFLANSAVPSASLCPLFSTGLTTAPVYRCITGADLPNPSTTTLGGVFSLPETATSILTGISNTGQPQFTGSTGTGNIVRATNPIVTNLESQNSLIVNGLGALSATIYLNSVPLLNRTGTSPAPLYHNMFSPAGVQAIQLGDAADPVNYYRASTQNFLSAANAFMLTLTPGNTFLGGTDVAAPSAQTLSVVGAATGNSNVGPSDFNINLPVSTGNAAQGNLIINTGFAATASATTVNARAPIATFGPSRLNGSSTTSLLALTQTLNTSGAPNVLDLNITQTATPSASTSLLNLRVNGTSRFKVAYDGSTGYAGATSGTHTVSAPVAAAGASTLPVTTGEMWNTGMGVPYNLQTVAVDFNTTNTDYPVTVVLPAGFTRYRIGSIIVVNTGTTASLTTATAGVFTAEAGGGTAIVASGTALSGATSNAPLTAGAIAPLTIVAAAGGTAYMTDTTLFFRMQTAQGAAASGYVQFQIIPIS